MQLMTRLSTGQDLLVEYSDEDVARFIEQASVWTSYIKDIAKGGEDTFDNGKWSAGEFIIEVPLEPKDYLIKNGELWAFMPHDFLYRVDGEWIPCEETYDGHLYKIEGMHTWQLLLDSQNEYESHKFYRHIKRKKIENP